MSFRTLCFSPFRWLLEMGTTSAGLLLWTLAWTLPPNVVADCAAGSSTLTTVGCSGCGEFDLCLGFTSKSECSGSGCETDGDCTYQCMNVQPNLSTLVVLVEFGGYKSSKEVAAGGFTLSGYPDLTDTWPSANNDDVTVVSTIDLSSAVSTFILSGGSADVAYPQGKVASVTLTDDLISSATAVTKVVLMNVDLDSEASSLPKLLPSTVESLDLENTLLSKFPAELGSLTSLHQLLLDNNYITTVDSLDVIDSITTLSLESNSITTFSGVFTNLEYLYLGSNNLTSIPMAIFSHSSLKILNLTDNALASRSFTTEQAEFLNNLETLELSPSDFTVGLECDDMQQVVVHDVTVCLSDGVTSSTNRASASSSTVDGSEDQTSSESSSTSLIFGVVCGILAVIIAAILFFFYRRKKKGFVDSKLSSTAEDSFPSATRNSGRRQPYNGLTTSTGVPMGIPMSESGVAIGIPTETTEGDASTGIPTTDEASTYPLSLGNAAPLGKKPATFLSIWSDSELLSLQVRVEDVEDVKQLGGGAFATVWLVRYRNSQLLASKRLRPERRTKKHTSNFVEEIKLIAHFEHPNLVKLIGAAWTIESDLQALLEYMDGGDLRLYLSDPSTPFGWSFRKFDIAIGMVEALVYLHSFVPPLVHRDLKSKNVLLSSDFQAKLSDFGTSRFRSVENTMTAGVGTGRWLAPEVIRGDTDYGCSADIYSFGALLTELDTNQIPYSNARGSNGKILTDMTILHRVATGKLHPEVRSTCGASLKALVERCLVEDPTKRPTATVIARTGSGRGFLLVLLVLTSIPNFVRGDCASGSSTLTTDGCSGCGDYDLCLGFTSKSECSGSGCETDGDCTYQCMAVDGNLTTLDVLIDFGGWKSAKETAMGGYTAAELAGYPDFTDTWPSANNDDVTAIGTVELSSAVETLLIIVDSIVSGGTAAVNYPQGKVASVTLTSDFISSATAVTRVVLQNIGLSSQVDDLPTFLPSTVKNLDLSNTVLSTFPGNLGNIKALEQLILDYNYITTVDAMDVMSSITTLSLEKNSISTFTGVFSNLEYLFLGENNLTSVPAAIYKHSYLKTLNLTGNAFTVREFTSAQAEYLTNLETLYLSDSDFTVDLDCDDSEHVAIHDVTVCLGSGVTASSSDKSAAATSTTKTDSTTDSKKSSSSNSAAGSDTTVSSNSSSSSSSTGIIVGIVCGVLVALFAAFLFVLYRRKQRDSARRKFMDSFSGTRFPSIDSDLVLQQPYDGLRTSAVFGMDIPMTSTEFSMLNRTEGGDTETPTIIPMTSTEHSMLNRTQGGDTENSMGIPTSVDGSMIPTSAQGTSAYPSSQPTEEAKDRNPNRFMSIWNDPDLLSLQVRAADVKDLKPLGSGAFALVWLVRYRESQLLASKRLRPERRTKKHTAMFIEEIKLIAKFDHPNLVNFIGAAWTIESDLQMLLEYMDGGDLRRYLADPLTPIGWTTRKFDIAIGVIEGLVYLHSFVPPLVHRDLKSKNVLLSADFTAKLSDFGASRFRSVENTMTGGVGTGRWLAPEVIRGDADYGSAADIYSFGALLTELDTNKIPYSNARASNGKILSDMTILHRVATGTLHPEVGSDCSPALKDLVEQCLVEDQTKRPAATAIAYELRLIKKDMAAFFASQSADLSLSELS
ncbi:Serine/threonine-protein kinase phg2 [Phytophthora citrophthora]|uniref:Serine/threonine-protein kinase phg2 n=1 Tax=Phytophthora citrophthora TaxID=4793 RepID=A0AAD9GKE8_9STRA|nr:Serine/threonine-protein kinase phg2 [Phytophthora citrophthora]